MVVPLAPLPAHPRIGIYMTAYNHAAFVAEAVESVLDQGIAPDRLQFLVINDGSTDGTREALRPYESRVRVIHQANGGLRAAVNRGMEELEADVVTSISGDDAWPAGRVDALLQAMAENPTAGLVYSDLEMMHSDGSTIHPSFMEMHGLVPYQGRIAGPLLTRNFVSGIGCMQRGALKSLVHPIPAVAAWEDYWWAWRIASVADVAYLPQSTCRYRQHDANLSLGADGDRLAYAWGEELRFRRWMLRDLRPGAVEAHHALDGGAALMKLLADMRDAGRDLREAAPVTDRDRAAAAEDLAAAIAAKRQDDPDEALRRAIAGLGADPFDPALQQLIMSLSDAVRRPSPPILHARSFVILVDAGEMRDRPELLTELARRFGPDDDATLVIHGRGWTDDRLAATFAAAAESIEMDVLAVADPPLRRPGFLERTSVVFGEYPALFDGAPPRVRSSEPDAVRARAERHWRAAPLRRPGRLRRA
jgi:GT2 family glycosyltransferase